MVKVIRRAFSTSKRYSVGKPTLVCALANFSADFGIITTNPAQRLKSEILYPVAAMGQLSEIRFYHRLFSIYRSASSDEHHQYTFLFPRVKLFAQRRSAFGRRTGRDPMRDGTST